jgi:hypothetical protein
VKLSVARPLAWFALRVFGLCIMSSACRIGGGSGPAGRWIVETDAASPSEAGALADASHDASSGAVLGTPDAASAPRAGQGQAGAAGSTQAGPAPDAGTDAASCTAPTVAVCNPMKNDICSDVLQCDVDSLSTTLAGQCVATPVTESCPPKATCHNGACRQLCFCDADCKTGECCNEPVGQLGFKVCGGC